MPGHRRLGSTSRPFSCSESTGKHGINLYVSEIGFQIYFGFQLYLSKAEELILALINSLKM